MITLHASAVVLDGLAVLLRGPSGIGKSDLALRLLDEGASFLADDYVELHANDEHIRIQAPEKIRGLLEVHGLGIVKRPALDGAPLGLVCDLVPASLIDRMPKRLHLLRLDDIEGAPIIQLDGRTASATARIRQLVAMIRDNPGEPVINRIV